MNTEDLIDRLVRDAKPVKQSPPPHVQMATWSAIGAAVLATATLWIGTRGDILRMWHDFEFVLHTVIVLGVAVLAARASFALSIPDRTPRVTVWVCALALAAWLALLISELMTSGHWHAGPGWRCLRNLFVLGVPLCSLMFLMVRRAAPLRSATVGGLGALAATAAADLATRFICKNDHASHALVWHFMPVIVMSCGGLVLGRVLLRWGSPSR